MALQYDMPLEALKEYKPKLTKEPDFEEFWDNSLKKLAQVPLKFERSPYDYPVKGVKVYRVSYLGFENANIEGWLAIPKGESLCPGIVLYHGYNWASEGMVNEVVDLALKGYVVMNMLVRGQQGNSVDNIVSSTGFVPGWMCKGILNPEEYYYRAVYLDAVRALEVLASMPEVDKTRIAVMGGSQGGALSLAAAALSDIPKVAVADYPYLSNFERAVDIAPQGPYQEIVQYLRRNAKPEIEVQVKKTLSYFDIMNLASRIKCRTWVSVGLVDEITPPSTIFAAYNSLTCPKEIAVYKYFGHEYIPVAVETKLRMLMDELKP
jgi:cephalosporin-C deacetylase